MFGQVEGGRSRLIGAIAIIGVIACLVVGLILFVPRQGLRTPADVEALLERDPVDRDAVHALKANFPNEYRQLLTHVADVGRDQGRGAAMRELTSSMERFIRSKASAIDAAPDRELQRIGGGQLALVRILRDENVRLCAQYSIDGLRPGTALPVAARASLASLSVYIIEAAAAGERSRQAPRRTLSEADSQAWVDAMGAIDPAVVRQLEADNLTRQPVEGQCHAGVVLYEAASRLPGRTAANVTAYLVRESLHPTPETMAPAPAGR